MTSPQQRLLGHYRYDALDRLINQSTVDAPQLQRFYCKSRLATEITGALSCSVFQCGKQLLAQQSGGDGSDVKLVATDQQRSVLSILDVNRSNPLAYSPYGHLPTENGLLSLLGFNGERRDSITGHYLLGNGYRAFSPVIMRFNSPDSLSPFATGGINPYVYCSGDPVNFTDPSGHFGEWLFKRVKGFLVGVPRNVPVKNSLEGLNFDAFQEVTRYLSRVDMDNLALTSRQLNKNSLDAGVSNLKQYLNFKVITRNPVKDQLSSSRTLTVHVQSAVGPEAVTVYPLNGVGSHAFKKLSSTVDGSRTLNKHVQSVRGKVKSDLPKNADGTVENEGELNALYARRLLAALR
nr:RHS repeat-associated core domain-containing protein [uncultured Pseudomonas sp.]